MTQCKESTLYSTVILKENMLVIEGREEIKGYDFCPERVKRHKDYIVERQIHDRIPFLGFSRFEI